MLRSSISRRDCLTILGAGTAAAATKRDAVNGEFPLIDVSGDSYQMGYQHGRQASELIQGYLRWIDKMTRRPRTELCTNAMHFLPYMEALRQKYVQEVKGLAKGAGISFEEAMLCQARGEASHGWEGGCTAFALTGKATADGLPWQDRTRISRRSSRTRRLS